jgi:hypothetical protein
MLKIETERMKMKAKGREKRQMQETGHRIPGNVTGVGTSQVEIVNGMNGQDVRGLSANGPDAGSWSVIGRLRTMDVIIAHPEALAPCLQIHNGGVVNSCDYG